MLRLIFIVIFSFTLTACASQQKPVNIAHQKQNAPGLPDSSYLAEGKRYFEEGFYKRAMETLLPIATDGDAEAQYAVGYMYYYGYGVAQDTNVGYFWIQRAARQQFKPAIQALGSIEKNGVLNPQHQPYPSR